MSDSRLSIEPISAGAYELIPDSCLDALIRYIIRGDPLGSFLEAIIRNDLVESAARADMENIQILHVYASFLFNFAPGTSWGSKDAIDKWRKDRKRSPLSFGSVTWPTDKAQQLARYYTQD